MGVMFSGMMDQKPRDQGPNGNAEDDPDEDSAEEFDAVRARPQTGDALLLIGGEKHGEVSPKGFFSSCLRNHIFQFGVRLTS